MKKTKKDAMVTISAKNLARLRKDVRDWRRAAETWKKSFTDLIDAIKNRKGGFKALPKWDAE